MKKRIFGILLMGAMVVASMSMFTSCKDYDDDIQANKDDITALKTQLATLQTALTTAQSAATAAQSAADAAATAAKNAQTAADNAGTAAKNAQASADDAAKAASANATAIKAAQDAIKALEDQVAAFAKVEELNAVKADLEKAIADATAGKVSAEELTEALKPISAKITAIDESLNTLDGDVKALKEWKSTVEGQIASVLADLKSQDAAVKALQEEIKNKITKGDLSGLANEDAIKAYVDNQLKAYAQNSEVSAAVANALKTYTTTADLQKMLAGYSTPAAVATAIENALKGYYTVAKTDEMISSLTTAINKAQNTASAAQTEEQVRTIAQSIADQVSADAGEKINTLNVLVNKILTSITLIPQTYINGIEAIQFVSVQYTPQVWAGDETTVSAQFPGPVPYTPAEYADAIDGSTNAAIAGLNLLWGTTAPISYLISSGTAPAFNPGTNVNPYARPLTNVRILDHQLEAVRDAAGNPVAPVTIDNGQTEAYYRVSPAAVSEDQIDKDNIKMVCTTANTQTRAVALRDNNPVKPAFKSLENGVLTVTLNKTVTGLIRYDGEDNGKNDNIASLMVPRLANEATGQEAAEIYSEFNLIDETIIEPRISALNKVGTAYSFNPAAAPHTATNPMLYHYIDSLHIFRSQVDRVDGTSPAGYLYVKENVQYNEEFDLLKLVTGCYETTAATHAEITKDDLKKYGIAFRFAIPARYATPESINQNETNQQSFIQFVDNGADKHIIKSKLPQGRTDNRASIGKEPIIRVMMIDTVRHNLVDQAYFKVKFVDNTPLKPAVPVEFTAAQTLSCTGNTMTIRWEDFIEKVYAQIGDNGLSWQQFRSYYPMANVMRIRNPRAAAGSPLLNEVYFDNQLGTGATNNVGGTYNDGTRDGIEDGDLGYNLLPGITNGKVELFFLQTTNPNQQSPLADANQLKWTVDGADVQAILPNRSKEVETKILFKSNDRSVYGDVVVTLKMTISLPDVPELTYYQNYWYDEYNSHYVLPVQYNTKAYYDQLKGARANNAQYNPANIDAANAYLDEQGTAGAYCVYNNNLFNAFTFNQTAASPYFNTPIPAIAGYGCATWDYQFRLNQPNAGVNARPQYWVAGATPATTEPLLGFVGTPAYTQTNQYTRPTPWVTNLDGHAYGAYNLKTQIGAVYNDAIWMNWYNDDKATNGNQEPGTVATADGSWAWNVADGGSRPYLFADHFNRNNQVLINPITSNGIGAAPTFSNNKKVNMGMFLAWNQWNVELMKNYTICLVAPLDINASLNGFFEEGLVSGSFVNCAGAFTMVDFRGYEVRRGAHTAAELAAITPASKREFYQYCDKLFNYYECQDPVFDLNAVKYGMKYENGSVVVDNTVTIDNIGTKGLTAAQIEAYTNGNVVLSIEQFNPAGVADTQWLRFKNNGGSNVEAIVNVFIPATMNYGFGSVTKYVQLKLYPRGAAPASRRK